MVRGGSLSLFRGCRLQTFGVLKPAFFKRNSVGLSQPEPVRVTRLHAAEPGSSANRKEVERKVDLDCRIKVAGKKVARLSFT